MEDHDRAIIGAHPCGAALDRRITIDFLGIDALHLGERSLPIVARSFFIRTMTMPVRIYLSVLDGRFAPTRCVT